MASNPNAFPQTSTQQYLRQCTLLVKNNAGQALDLSQLRIKFQVKMTGTAIPNTADIRVYNLDYDTAIQIKKEFTGLALQGGYQANYGIVIEGSIKQVIVGRESATDTYIDILVGDGDIAYNFAIVNLTLPANSIPVAQINVAASAMSAKGGTTLLPPTNLGTTQLARAKVMFGAAKKYLRRSAQNSRHSWSIQNGQIQFVPINGFLPGEAVVLTSKTGMVGTPQQTNNGVNAKCLMNPLIKVGGRVQINNASVIGFKIDLTQPGSPANSAIPLSADGMYYVWTIAHSGDTRSNDPWFTELVLITSVVSANPLNATQTSFSG